jgi:hypothetical protein
VQFDRGEFIFKINITNPCLLHQQVKFIEQVIAVPGPHVCEVDFGG